MAFCQVLHSYVLSTGITSRDGYCEKFWSKTQDTSATSNWPSFPWQMLYCCVDTKLEYSNRVVILLIMWVMAERKRSSLCWRASDYCACAMGLGSQRARSFLARRALSQQGKNERKERVSLLPVISSFSFPPYSLLISFSLLSSHFSFPSSEKWEWGNNRRRETSASREARNLITHYLKISRLQYGADPSINCL